MTPEHLFNLLATYGGRIISTNSLDTWHINNARASERMWVNEDGLGFIWEPEVKRFPETPDEVKLFQSWYPIDADMPESLKDLNWLVNRTNQ